MKSDLNNFIEALQDLRDDFANVDHLLTPVQTNRMIQGILDSLALIGRVLVDQENVIERISKPHAKDRVRPHR